MRRIDWKLKPEAEGMLMEVFTFPQGMNDAVLYSLRTLEEKTSPFYGNKTLPKVIEKMKEEEESLFVPVICHAGMTRFVHKITFELDALKDFEYIRDGEGFDEE